MLKVKTKIILLIIFFITVWLIVYNTVWLNRTPKFKFTEFHNISEYEFTDYTTTNILQMNDKDVLYAIGEYDPEKSQFVFDHSLKLGNLSNNNSQVLTSSFKEYTYVSGAESYLEGYLISYATLSSTTEDLYDNYLVYFKDDKETLIDYYKGPHQSNNYLDFEIVGNKIIYMKNPIGQPSEIIIYDMAMNTKESIKLKNETILDTDIKSAGNLIAYFVDIGEQSAFDIYNIVSNKTTRIPFERKYRLYDYELTTDGIIASIASEASPDYVYADDKKSVLFISLNGKQTLVDTNSRFSLTSNGKVCIGVDDDIELFSFDLKNSKINSIQTGDVGKIYKWPAIMSADNDDFYILAEWVYENYDTEEKVVRVTPY